jgi:lipopolysaccharide transport system ATP-binding protein
MEDLKETKASRRVPGDESLIPVRHSPAPGPDIAVSVKGVSKKYRLYDSPKHRLKEALHPFRKKYHREFWALRDVSFELKKGETVGIVGKNGSGKSTLLQILCGILQPTGGEVSVIGRISALLELGAGFNPEFTGRGNIYLNGAIKGFTKEEMDDKFDDIAGFADIGNFMDQPVKTYSSGMYIRLAFAAAINIAPDILIVDEALSVGDEAFQRKCFSRIQAIQEKGSTILFVSHNASAVVELCKRAILLDNGELLLSGKPKRVVARYHKMLYAAPEKIEAIRAEYRQEQRNAARVQADSTVHEAHEASPGIGSDAKDVRPAFDPALVPKSCLEYESRGARIRKPEITNLDGDRVNMLVHGQEYLYRYSVYFEEEAFNVRFGMLIKTIRGLELGGIASHTTFDAVEFIRKDAVVEVSFRFKCLVGPGVYFLNAGLLGTRNGAEIYLHRVVDALMFRVLPERNLLATGTIDFSVEGEGASINILLTERVSTDE